MKTVTVIIPCFNEERTIARVIDEVLAASTFNLNKEVIVIDDGSTDGSFSEIQKYGPRIQVLRNGSNRGKGFSVRQGLHIATGDIIIIQDADLEYSPSDYENLIRPIQDSTALVVFGTRSQSLSRKEKRKLFYWGGRFVNRIANFLFQTKIQDIHSGYKVFHRSLLPQLNLKCEGFSFCHELTAQIIQQGHRIFEVPISYSPRGFSQGKKIRAIDGALAVMTLVSETYKVRKLKRLPSGI